MAERAEHRSHDVTPCEACGSANTVETLRCLGWVFHYCADCEHVWKTRTTQDSARAHLSLTARLAGRIATARRASFIERA